MRNLLILIFFLLFSIELFSKDLSLTQEEQNYLNSKEYISFVSLKTFPPFSFVENGKAKGFTIDYMDILGKSLNKEIRFKTVNSWSEGLEMLENGTIDLIPHIAITQDRKKFIDFTNFNHITYLTGFAVEIGSNIKTIDDLKDKSVAVANRTFLHEYLKKNFPEMNLVLSKSTEDAISAVSKGKADAVIGSLPALNFYIHQQWRNNIKVVNIEGMYDLKKTELPMGVAKGNSTLKSILEKANDALSYSEISELKNSWMYKNSRADETSLTKEEEAFLVKHPKIRFVVQNSRPPFEFVVDNKPQGLAVDYMNVISKKMGFTPVYVIDKNPKSDLHDEIAGERKRFDTRLFSVKSKTRENKFSFGDAYLSYPMMIITSLNAPYIGKIEDLYGKKVAIERGYSTNLWIKRDHPKIEIVNADNTIEALKLVNNNDAMAYIGNLAVANYMINNGGLDNIKIAAPTSYGDVEFSFIAPKQWPELASILSKGYRQITPKEHNLLQQKWFSIQFIENTNYLLIGQILGAVFVVVILILYWNRKLSEKVHEGIAKYKEQEIMLIQQSKMAAMGEMINNITHQWKQPLNAISIYSQEIEEIIEYEDSNKESLLNVEKNILKQVSLMDSTINDFRNFFKPSTVQDSFNICDVSHETMSLMASKLKRGDISMEIDCQNCFNLYGYANEFKQVLLNLINNACDAFEGVRNKEKTIKLSFHIEDEKAIIILQDNGTGIPKELLPTKLFDSYVTTKGENGTGIGLYMCQFIIREKFNGKVLASNTSNGAQFTIELASFSPVEAH